MHKDKFVSIGIIFILLGVILGAFGAHFLKDILKNHQLLSFQTGIRYQIYHGFAILIFGLNAKKFSKNIQFSLILFTLGIILFSFSIYAINLKEITGFYHNFIPIFTPIGGSTLIIGWITTLFCLKKN